MHSSKLTFHPSKERFLTLPQINCLPTNKPSEIVFFLTSIINFINKAQANPGSQRLELEQAARAKLVSFLEITPAEIMAFDNDNVLARLDSQLCNALPLHYAPRMFLLYKIINRNKDGCRLERSEVTDRCLSLINDLLSFIKDELKLLEIYDRHNKSQALRYAQKHLISVYQSLDSKQLTRLSPDDVSFIEELLVAVSPIKISSNSLGNEI